MRPSGAYSGGVKEFAVYNVMRLLLLASWVVIVIGVWSLFSDEVPILWALIIALLGSGISSWFLLRRQREALALRLQGGAEKASSKFEQMRQPVDGDQP